MWLYFFLKYWKINAFRLDHSSYMHELRSLQKVFFSLTSIFWSLITLCKEQTVCMLAVCFSPTSILYSSLHTLSSVCCYLLQCDWPLPAPSPLLSTSPTTANFPPHYSPRPLFDIGSQLLEILHGRLSSDKDANEEAVETDIQGGGGGEGAAGGVETYEGNGLQSIQWGGRPPLYFLNMPDRHLEKVTRLVNVINLLFHLPDDTRIASSMNDGF